MNHACPRLYDGLTSSQRIAIQKEGEALASTHHAVDDGERWSDPDTHPPKPKPTRSILDGLDRTPGSSKRLIH